MGDFLVLGLPGMRVTLIIVREVLFAAGVCVRFWVVPLKWVCAGSRFGLL